MIEKIVFDDDGSLVGSGKKDGGFDASAFFIIAHQFDEKLLEHGFQHELTARTRPGEF